MQNAQNGVSEKNISEGIELDSITTKSGYNQMIDKLTHYIKRTVIVY